MTEEQRPQLPAEVWERLHADSERPSPVTREVWGRLHRALDAGAPVPLACQYAGLPYATWLAESLFGNLSAVGSRLASAACQGLVQGSQRKRGR
jgi:hypothetical protein